MLEQGSRQINDNRARRTRNNLNLDQDPERVDQEENHEQDLDLDPLALEHGTRYRRTRQTQKKNSELLDQEIGLQNGDVLLQSCGELSSLCNFCGALRWASELSSFCCQNRKVTLPVPPTPPPNVQKYYDGTVPDFLTHVRSYNNALALASIGCEEISLTGFNPTFTIQSKLCYRLGA